MEFGFFQDFVGSPGRSEPHAFAESFEQIDAAERWGLDAVWLAELHFGQYNSVLSSPVVIASAIAVRTSRIKIGTAVQVLPLCHPVRLAEEIATLDQISRGRLIFGVGRSSLPGSYIGYGVPYAEGRERAAEILEILKRALTEESFSYQGKFHRFSDIRLVPKPYQKPYPPIRIAAASAETCAAIGRLGHPVFISARLEAFADLVPFVRAYRAAYKAAGHDGEGGVYLRLPVYVAASDAEARAEFEPSIMSLFRDLGGRLEATVSASGPAAEQERREIARRLLTITYEDVLEEKAVIGSPGMVVDRLRQLQRELGLDGILAELSSGSLVPHRRVMTALRLLSTEVMPRFK
jgi:alkanesulfonate monooxygenase SsuD/methylene tetrahydromethanopterin reductase-like flavin-dependent oxidoreductase (luciferase family)